jgi:hypothetical protein
MRHKLSKTLITVLGVMMIVPLAAVAAEDTTTVEERPTTAVTRVGPVSDVAPDVDRVRTHVSDRPIVRVRDVRSDRITDRVTDRRHRDRPNDRPHFLRRLVSAGCIAELPNGEWEWTGACGPDELRPGIRRLINRLLHSHLWRQLYRLLHWLNG